MLKLKIGKNFLLVNYTPDTCYVIDKTIPYMMGCFKGENKLAIPAIIECFQPHQVIKIVRESRAKELYLLAHTDILELRHREGKMAAKDYTSYMARILKDIITELHNLEPTLVVKVINMNASYKTGAYKVSVKLYNILKEDKDNILSVLPRLDMYKSMTQRLAAIPQEIKIVENDIRKLSKDKKICDRKVSLQSIEYLKLIEDAKLDGPNLLLQLKPLPIYPSEELGVVFGASDFRNNPYLFKAASYIYQGCHFQMPATKIRVSSTDFRPEFLETLDKRWDTMFAQSNWSTVGYPHFGENHFCPGEFNDTMAHAKEYGLDYYFISLKQYLTTANMRDTAGFRVWWYPIYNNDGEMVYCAGMDIAIEEVIKKLSKPLYDELQTKTWDEKATMLVNKINYRDSAIQRYGHGNLSYYTPQNRDNFLELCKTKNPDLYKTIMKGREN